MEEDRKNSNMVENLLFRLHREDTYSSNIGNFIEFIQLMIKYDIALGKHYLKEVNDNRRKNLEAWFD